MKRSLQGQAAIWVVIFMGLSVVFAGLGVSSYMNIIEHKEELATLAKRRNSEAGEVESRKEKFRQIVNLTGFYTDSPGESPDATIDAIATRLGRMYISEDLNLRLISNPQSAFRVQNASPAVFEALDQYKISDELRQTFAAQGHELAPDARVSYQNPSRSKWLVGGAEQSRLYLLAKDRSMLSVSVLIDKALLTSCEDVKRVEGLYELWQACTRRITYQSDIESEWGLQQQLGVKERNLAQARVQYEQEQNKTKRDIQDLVGKIQKLAGEIVAEKAKYQQKLQDVHAQMREIERQRLNAKQRVTRLLRQKFYQERYHQDILGNLDQRIRELEQEVAGERSIEERLDAALAAIDEFSTEQPAAKDAAKTAQPGKQAAVGKVKLQDTPDGEIVHVDRKMQTVFVDLGRQQGIVQGLKFEVFRYGKGGSLQKKGEIVVREVRDTMSMAGITAIQDPTDFIGVGDKIINRIYDAKKTRHFVVAGTLSKHSVDEFRRLVEGFGAKLENEITAKTEMIILGQGFNDHPVFQRGLERGIEMMLEAKFLGYIEGE